MANSEPILFFFLFGLVMFAMILMVRLSDASGELDELKEKVRMLTGEKPEEPPEWF